MYIITGWNVINPCTAELLTLTQLLASNEWKIILFMKNRHLYYWIIGLTDKIYKNYLIKLSDISIDLKHAWNCIHVQMVLAAQGLKQFNLLVTHQQILVRSSNFTLDGNLKWNGYKMASVHHQQFLWCLFWSVLAMTQPELPGPSWHQKT